MNGMALHARRGLFVVMLVVVHSLAPRPVRASGHDEEPPTPDHAVLLVLTAAPEAATEEGTGPFITQLQLALDGFDVVALPMDEESFLHTALSHQLEWIRPRSAEAGAVATVWLEQTEAGTTLLHLVALSTDRALVRIVEAPGDSDPYRRLALVAQELLGEAYLMSSVAHPPAVAEVVTMVREELALDLDPVEDPAPPPALYAGESPARRPIAALASRALLTGGVAGHNGRQTAIGGLLGAALLPVGGLSLALEISAQSGPRDAVSGGAVTGWSISPGLSASYFFGPGRIQAGPRLGIQAVYAELTVHPDTHASQPYHWWNVRSTAGAAVQWHLTDRFGLVLNAEFGFHARRKSFRWSSDDTQLFLTPYVDGCIAIGGVVWL